MQCCPTNLENKNLINNNNTIKHILKNSSTMERIFRIVVQNVRVLDPLLLHRHEASQCIETPQNIRRIAFHGPSHSKYVATFNNVQVCFSKCTSTPKHKHDTLYYSLIHMWESTMYYDTYPEKAFFGHLSILLQLN